ncbi:MAG: efflux RND transporter periplasmic adaptor subunit [Planctomycetota bacterium]|jgi:multidrug efflux pump subunit AcrA (membrane-fusion protein)
MNADSPRKTNTKLADRWAHLGRLRWVLILIALLVGAGTLVSLRSSSGGTSDPGQESGIFTVKRGDLTISVTESGDIRPVNSIDITSQVEGETTLISIVDEGTYITPEDVNNGKILAELDSSEIKEELTKQQIDFLTARADYTDANEALQIQKKQNDSDIQTGEMNFRFALMDLQKYLGDAIAAKLISYAAKPTSEHTELASFINDANSDPNLRCEAIQMLRELEDNIKLADMKLARAKDKLEGTRKLYEKEYVAEIELKADELEEESLEIQKKQAETAKDLFIKYEFPKEAETRLSGYYEAERELDRIKAGARSKLAQAEAKLESEKATFFLETERLEKWRRQLKACTIRAPAPGQVVYGSSLMDRWRRRSHMIEVGAEIDERQKIISIPDLSQMKVEVKIHETWVDKVQPEQGAKITISALPDQTFTGKVLKKAPLPNPEDFLNPDLKVYTTDVSIEGTHESLKTGMTAKVEIIIDELHDVLSVPIQSVINVEGKKICFVATGKGTQRREVETGAFNDSFVEIKSGLAEGEKVMLNPPRLTELGKTSKKEFNNK